MLYLHLGVDAARPDAQGRKALDLLRRHGIRTATDLEAAHAAASARGPEAEAEFLDLLPTEGDGDPLLAGHVYVAPPDRHTRKGGYWVLHLSANGKRRLAGIERFDPVA